MFCLRLQVPDTVSAEGDLFSAGADEILAARAPLAQRMRPRSLDEVVGQSHLCAPAAPLRMLVESDQVSSMILWGPPGTGKTTIAEIIASTTSRAFERLSAVSAGIKDVREVIESARRRLAYEGRGTVLFIDEIHRFTTVQQDALLHAVETGLVCLVGATTENPAFSVNPALRSRSTVFALRPVSEEALVSLVSDAATREGIAIDAEALGLLARRVTGDARLALGTLEIAATLGDGQVGAEEITRALDTAVTRLGRDEHYDIASAFIKAMRASDVDVALHWLARLLESGEDPRFIARRLIIFASEDIGLADSFSMLVAVAAAEALDRVGLPEASHSLAHATIHLSLAPKSRAVADALSASLSDVREGQTGPAPATTAEPPSHLPVGFRVPQRYREDR